MSWYLAPPLVDLRNEINSAYPNRAKISDGSVGDTSHAARVSDHNPDRVGANLGEVRAIDVTQWDPGSPLDPNDDVAEAVAEYLRKKKDPRIKYVIWRGRMFSSYATSSTPAWTWRPYTGPNGHFHHVHVSTNEYAKGGAWGFKRPSKTGAGTKPRQWLTLHQGDTDESIAKRNGMEFEVTEAQLILKALSIRWKDKTLDPGAVDGDYGPIMAKAVAAFQKRQSKFVKDFKLEGATTFWKGPFPGKAFSGHTIAALRWWNGHTT